MEHREIGGFFELELPSRDEYHKSVVALNSGRNCLAQLVLTKNIQRLHVPVYSCDGLIAKQISSSVEIKYYAINECFEPKFPTDIKLGDVFLYINYFGLYDHVIAKLYDKGIPLIIDNTHGFFSYPHQQLDTLYSPRKFFGVSDGGYLYANANYPNAVDTSHQHAMHLLKRIDGGASSAYEDYLRSETTIAEKPIARMSALTKRILQSIDYASCKTLRNENFLALHKAIGSMNELSIETSSVNGPYAYPFLIRHKDLRRKLIDSKIFVPQLWKEVLQRSERGSYEHYTSEHLLPLPIDQRYNTSDMHHIAKVIQYYLQKG